MRSKHECTIYRPIIIQFFKILTYRCFWYWKESKVLDNCAQSNFHLFHGEPHADTIAWSHSERHESVLVRLNVAIRVPSIMSIPRDWKFVWRYKYLFFEITCRDWICKALDSTLRRNEEQKLELSRLCPSWYECHYRWCLHCILSQLY